MWLRIPCSIAAIACRITSMRWHALAVPSVSINRSPSQTSRSPRMGLPRLFTWKRVLASVGATPSRRAALAKVLALFAPYAYLLRGHDGGRNKAGSLDGVRTLAGTPISPAMAGHVLSFRSRATTMRCASCCTPSSLGFSNFSVCSILLGCGPFSTFRTGSTHVRRSAQRDRSSRNIEPVSADLNKSPSRKFRY